MDLRCPSCNAAYDRTNHMPHFIQCGCDICSTCLQKYVYRTSPTSAAASATANSLSASTTNSRPTTPTGPRRRSASQVSQNENNNSNNNNNGSSNAPLVSPVVPVVVTQSYKCTRGHVTSAAIINSCPPMIAHRIAEQVRDKSQTCTIHQRRPLDFWCVPCRRSLCSVCAVSHKEESNCLLPARPIQQCTGEILKLAYECKGALDSSSRAVQNCQLVTSRMLKSGSGVPVELMNQCLVAVEQFHTRILKSVDSVWREHMTEMKNVKRAHAALSEVQNSLESYKEKMVSGERLCDETDASTRTVDPLPLAATMAAIEDDQLLKFPLKLYLLRGIESIALDPSGTTISAAWHEPFHGKGEFTPFQNIGSSQSAAAASMLDRASSPIARRHGSAGRRPYSPVQGNKQNQNNLLPNAAQVTIDGTPTRADDQQQGFIGGATRGHTPLGLFSVTEILNMGPNMNNPNSISRTKEQQQQQQFLQQQNSNNNNNNNNNGSGRNSRSNTPTRRAAGGRSNQQTPPSESGLAGGSPYVQIRNFNPYESNGNNLATASSATRRR